MRTQRRVFEKLSETTKVELASEKIELNRMNELKSNFNKLMTVSNKADSIKDKVEKAFQSGQKELQKLQSESETLIKLIRNEVMDIDAIYKDLGEKTPAKITSLFDDSSQYQIQISNLANIYS